MSTRTVEALLFSCTAILVSCLESFWYMWIGTMYALVLSSPHYCKGQNLRRKLTSGDCVYVLPLGVTIATSLYALVKIRMCCRLSIWNALNYFLTMRLFLYHVPQWLGLLAVLDHNVTTLLHTAITLREAATLFFGRETRQELILKWSFTLKVAGAQPWQRPAPTERRYDLYVNDAVTANTLLL